MAIDDLASLRSEVPDLFLDRDLPAAWEEDWVFAKIDDPESARLPGETLAPIDDIETWITPPDSAAEFDRAGSIATTASDFGAITAPDFSSSTPFPGAPHSRRVGDYVPPPDCLGFYLPSTTFIRSGGVYTLSSRAFRGSPTSSTGRQGEY